jgi:transposase
MGKAPIVVEDDSPASDGKRRGKRKGNRGTGRRDLRSLPLEEERVVISDPHLEALVDQGKVVRHGFEETCKIAHKRGGKRRLVIARVRYKTVDAAGDTDVITTAMPEQMLPGAIAAPSLVAHVIMENIGKGMPLFRIEDGSARDGVPFDRGSLSRWKKTVGDRLAATVVHAMRQHALATAFCIATDATGICVQPIPNERTRQPCKKGHFLVQIADRDHILFDYLEHETSAAIYSRFRGFSGYVQADAKSVFNLLYRLPEQRPPPDEGEPDQGVCTEVGCWSHARRGFWEAALTKDPLAREALLRIQRIFDADRALRDRRPDERKSLRDVHVRPYVEDFLAWSAAHYEMVKDRRGPLRSAFGYAVRQADALRRFLDDGRLNLTNNQSERELRRIAVGRKAWLFVGSDDHAQAAGNLFSLIASARLHRLDPEAYLRHLIRVLPHWPRGRFLELAPRYWTATRARLDPAQLEAELGPLTVPSGASPTPEQSAPR